MGAPNYITDNKGNIVYPRTLAKCVKKGGTTLDDYLDKVEDNLLIKPTAQGTEINLTDSSDMNIQELHIYGRTEQASTTGANLFDVNDRLSFNSIFKVDEEGYITATIPANNTEDYQYYNFFTKKSDLLKIDTEYLIVTEILEIPTEKCQLNIISLEQISKGQFTNAVAKATKGIKFDKIKTRDDMSGCVAMMRGFMFTKPGFTGGKIKFRVSVLEDTTITADTFKYESYTGGQPSPNPDYPQEIKSIENPTVSVAGKNLFEPSTINYSYNNLRITANVDNSQKNSIKIKINTINATEGDLYALAYVDINKFVKKIKSNTTYTIVLKNPQNIDAVFVGTIIGMNRITNTVAVKSNVIKLQTIDDISNKSTFPLVFYFAGTVKENVTIGFDDIAVYEGDYPNAEIEEFKEIQSAQQTCELNGIDDIRDELIVRADGTGTLIQRFAKESVKFNKLIESQDCAGRYVIFNYLKNHYKSVPKCLCNIANRADWGEPAYKKWVFSLAEHTVYISPPKGSGYTVDTLKEYLANADVMVMGEIKEPIVTELSSEEVQKILALHTNKPNTTIWNDQDAEMQVTYVADTKKYIDDKFEELSEAITTSTTIDSLDTSN